MKTRNWFSLTGVALFLGAGWLAAAPAEKIRNENVLVVEQALAPGETLALPASGACTLIYLDDGKAAATPVQGTPGPRAVKRGDVMFAPVPTGTVKNAGATVLRVVRIGYLGKGSPEFWGRTGLSPNYVLLWEDSHSRIYDIKIPAGTSEPQHTHHNRVVVCLSGAELRHEMPDGRTETSTLKTDEIVWRRGGTHVGHNLGKTDLWVLAIEPK